MAEKRHIVKRHSQFTANGCLADDKQRDNHNACITPDGWRIGSQRTKVEYGDSYDIINNGVQYIGMSNSEYIAYNSNYINEFEIFYNDGVTNPSTGLDLTPFTAAILTYTADSSWTEGIIMASEGITLVNESLGKVSAIPMPVPANNGEAVRKELRIFMSDEFRQGQLDIRIGNMHKIIKIKREDSFSVMGGVVSLGKDIAFLSAHTLANPISTIGLLCGPETYSVAYSETGNPLKTGDCEIETDPDKELFLQIKNRFGAEKSDYCYGELYLHRNTSAGRTKVSFSVEMHGQAPFGDYSNVPQAAISQAFWRSDEKGERLVQLTQNKTQSQNFPYVGRWQARVLVVGGIS